MLGRVMRQVCGQDDLAQTGPGRHADRARRLALAGLDGREPRAEDLAQHRGAVQRQAKDGGRKGRDAESDIGQPEVDEEDLGQNGRVAEQLDIGVEQKIQHAAAQQPQQGHQQAANQRHSQGRQGDRDRGGRTQQQGSAEVDDLAEHSLSPTVSERPAA